MKHRIFISSLQKEFASERRALFEFIEGDALLSRFFSVFLFENLPASGRRANKAYLTEVNKADIYIGLFGNEYGSKDAKGLSPTEHEFNRATLEKKERLIFVKGTDDKSRAPAMLKLIRKASDLVIRRRFNTTSELISAVYASLVDYLAAKSCFAQDPSTPPRASRQR